MFEDNKEFRVPPSVLRGLKLNKWYRIIGTYDGVGVKWFVKEQSES